MRSKIITLSIAVATCATLISIAQPASAETRSEVTSQTKSPRVSISPSPTIEQQTAAQKNIAFTSKAAARLADLDQLIKLCKNVVPIVAIALGAFLALTVKPKTIQKSRQSFILGTAAVILGVCTPTAINWIITSRGCGCLFH